MYERTHRFDSLSVNTPTLLICPSFWEKNEAEVVLSDDADDGT